MREKAVSFPPHTSGGEASKMSQAMADYILHALFHRDAGMELWIEQVEGHRVVLPEAVPDGEFPPVITDLLAQTHFRHTQPVTLRTPKGKTAKLTIPVAALTPQAALTFLSAVAVLTPPGGIDAIGHDALGADLRWMAHMYRGVTEFVAAGRVIPRLKWIDGSWYPQWELVGAIAINTWLSHMQQAAPGVLVINAGPQLAEEVAGYLSHWVASDRLSDIAEDLSHPQSSSEVWHPFVRALVLSSPVRRVTPAVISTLNEWKTSVTAARVRMVLVVEEPTPVPDDSLAGFPHWVIRTQVRIDEQPPQPIRGDFVDASVYSQLRRLHAQAVSVTDLLDHTVHTFRDIDESAHLQVPGDVPSFAERRGDFDVSLTNEQFLQFIEKAVPKLTKKGFEVLLPRGLGQGRVRARVTAETAAQGMGPAKLGLDQLVAFDWTVSVGETELTKAEMEELVSSASQLVKIRDRWVQVDSASLSRVREYMAQIAKSTVTGRDDAEEADGEEGGITVTSVRALRQLALMAAEDELLSFSGSTWVSALAGGGAELPPPQPVDIPDSVHAQLREYQHRGVDWLVWMSEQGLGAVLADDMGLGKTLQLLAMLAVEHDRNHQIAPTLVVAPTTVVSNWQREAARFVPSLRVMVYHGSARPRGADLVRAVSDCDLVITSYGTLSRDFADLQLIDWDHLVLDEAQAIKNTSTAAAQAARIVSARQKIALTGTPIENHLTEMRAILDFTNPGILGSAAWFRSHFAKPIERDHDSEVAATFRTLTAPFILRRVKTDPNIIEDLPDKEEHVALVELTAEQAALYTSYVREVEAMLAEAKETDIQYKGLVLKSLTKLKQICNHPAQFLGDGSPVTQHGHHRSGKLAELEKIVTRARADGKKVLVFTQYVEFGLIIQEYLSTIFGEEVPFLYGKHSKKKRDDMVAQFQSVSGPDAFILSLKAGGTGINLTAASVVIHMDRWWNPAVENQATDRAYRIGQTRDVEVYKLVTVGTLEEHIAAILDGKVELADAVVGVGEGWLINLKPAQLAELIQFRSEAERSHDGQ